MTGHISRSVSLLIAMHLFAWSSCLAGSVAGKRDAAAVTLPPDPRHLISRSGVGALTLGMRIRDARKIIDGSVSIFGREAKVFRNGKLSMTLQLAGDYTRRTTDLDARSFEDAGDDANIQKIEVYDPSYVTKTGIGPGISLTAASKIGGRFYIFKHRNEELLNFSAESLRICDFIVRCQGTTAGVYDKGSGNSDANRTELYSDKAIISFIRLGGSQ